VKQIAASFAILAALAFVSCANEQKKTEPVKADKIEEGWISDNEFRVKVSGETELSSTDQESLQKASEAAAVKKARETVVKNFVTTRMKQSQGAGTYAVIALSIDRDFREIIEGGKIIVKTFDNGDKKCSILYSIEKSGLKQMVENQKK
jgi:hypothetical protein